MQTIYSPRIADYDDFLAVERVIEDIHIEAENELDFNNGDLRDQDRADFKEMINDRYEDQLERDSNRFGGCEW